MTRQLRRFLAVAGLALSLAAVTVAGQSGRHPLTGRQYAGPMSFEGAPWLDRSEREREESPEQALRIIGIAPGSTVADVGAGSGYFTLKMAKLVGPTGRVYACDIQREMLDILGRKLKPTGLGNVSLVLGTGSDPKLPADAIDLALLVDVYHEFLEPQAMLKRLHAAIKPGGRLVLLEYREEDPRVPINPLHKMSVQGAKREVEAEGFVLSTVNEDLPWQHVLIFTRP